MCSFQCMLQTTLLQFVSGNVTGIVPFAISERLPELMRTTGRNVHGFP
jgi:hypothetical protein